MQFQTPKAAKPRGYGLCSPASTIQTLSFWEILLNRILYITTGNIFILYLFLMEMQTFTFMRIMN